MYNAAIRTEYEAFFKKAEQALKEIKEKESKKQK